MLDLISRVQGEGGYFALLGLHDAMPTIQKLYPDRETFDAKIFDLSERGYNVFFGVAKYQSSTGRTKANVATLKAVWLDLDCSEEKAAAGKGYRTQAAALEALKTFCHAVGLPKPIIVNSGYGIHAYWVLATVLVRHEWEPISLRLKEVCQAQGLIVDAAVFEASRVLRIPGTINRKDGGEKLAYVLHEGAAATLEVEALKKLLGVREAPLPKAPLSPLQQSLQGNMDFSFTKIMLRSLDGKGCHQLRDQALNANSVSEPSWFDAISIAARCKDRDKAIHLISQGHDEYDAEKTEQKANNSNSPHTCRTFEDNNPGGCEGCTWRGKIKTPLVLGREIKESMPDEEGNLHISAVPERHEIAPSITEELEEVTEYSVPNYPWPYFRGANGGVYTKGEGEDNAAECLYEHDLYVVKRMFDPNPDVGELALFRLHLPMDGVREFSLPLSVISSKDKLREVLASKGVLVAQSKFAGLMNYIYRSFKEIQLVKKAEQMRNQFGWVDNDKCFVIGDREVRGDLVGYCPPAGVTKELAAAMQPKGSLEKWKEVFELYNTPGLEANAFAALAAFGSPLLKFTGHSGAMINLIHPTSGTGKSTALYMCNSVYGHPVKLTSIWRDTLAAKMMHLGVLKNIPFTCDELTNMSEQDHSTLVYSMSQGRGPNRVKASANEMRVNNTTWQTISVTTSNASIYEKLGAYKSSPDGEMMRLLEYPIEPTAIIDPNTAKRMFDHQLRDNYGHAGQIYVQYLINNLEESVQGLAAVQQKIDRDAKLTSRERFWSAVIACNIAGGLIAKRLGLIDWDMKRIYLWAVGMLKTIREEAVPVTSHASHILGDFLNEHINGLLVVNNHVDRKSGLQSMPLREPRGELTARYEPDTQMLYISSKMFSKYCAEHRISRRVTLKNLEESGVFAGAQAKRMSKGMGFNAPAMMVLAFRGESLDSLDIEALAEVAPEN